MKIIQHIINNRVNKIIQGESNRTRAVLLICKEAGYPLKNIRKALWDLEERSVKDLEPETDISRGQLYNVLNGKRVSGPASEKGKLLIAGALGLEAKEIFEVNRQ